MPSPRSPLFLYPRPLSLSLTGGRVIRPLPGLRRSPGKGTVVCRCGTRVKTNQCTNERVDLGKSSGTYCRVCGRKQLTAELTANERKRTCRTSRMGCTICKERICTECWKEGYDKHECIVIEQPCDPTAHTYCTN